MDYTLVLILIIGVAVLIAIFARYFVRRRRKKSLGSRYEQKLEQWEKEGYDVSEFKEKWFG